MRERIAGRVAQLRSKSRPLLIGVVALLLLSGTAVAAYSVVWSEQLQPTSTFVQGEDMASNPENGMVFAPAEDSVIALYPNGTRAWTATPTSGQIVDVEYYDEKDLVVWVDQFDNRVGSLHASNGTESSTFSTLTPGAGTGTRSPTAIDTGPGYAYYSAAGGYVGKIAENGTVVYENQVYTGGEDIFDVSYEQVPDRMYTSSSGGLKAIDAGEGTTAWTEYTSTGVEEVTSDYPYVYAYNGGDLINVTDDGTSATESWRTATSATPQDISSDANHIYLALPVSGADNETVVYSYDGTIDQGIDASDAGGISTAPSYQSDNVSVYMMDDNRQVVKIQTEIQSPEPPAGTDGNLSIDSRDYIKPNETDTYSVYFEQNNQTTEVTDQATVSSNNTSVLVVNAAEDELVAQSGVNTTVNVTASYTASDGAVYTTTKQIAVAQATVENLQILPTIWRFSATIGDDTMFFLIVAMLAAVVGTRFSTAFGGISLYWTTVMIGWFSGWLSLGILLVTTVMCIFVGLNLAANIDYGAVGSIRR